MQSLDAPVVTQALEWARGGDTVWYCSPVDLWLVPREPGSIMVANASGDHVGSLSAGVSRRISSHGWWPVSTMPAVIVRYGAPGSGMAIPRCACPVAACSMCWSSDARRRRRTFSISNSSARRWPVSRSCCDASAWPMAPRRWHPRALAGRVCAARHLGRRSPARGARSQTHSRRILLGGRRLRALRPAVGIRCVAIAGGGRCRGRG